MSIYDQDTDPSSPEARAARQATPEPAVTASPRSATTDPGVGPPSVPGTARAMGVVVPAGTPKPPSVAQPLRGVPVTTPSPGRTAQKDSVELLLEGMGGARPDRTKTTRQTGGEASAAYHAEHSLRAGHSGQDEDMKVLVDTVRLPAAAESSELALRFAGEPTFVLQSRLGPRIVVAALAGLLVVATIFTFFSWGPGPKSAFSSRDPAVAAPDLPKPAAIPMPVIPAAAEPAAAAPPPVAEAPVAPAAVEAPPPSLAPAPAAVASRTKSTGHARKSASDVAEFKTQF